MPEHSRSLDLDGALALSRAMFAGTGTDLFGLEVEWPIHHVDDVAQRPDATLIAELEGLELPGNSRVTFEPGGQMELSTLPFPSMAEALRAVGSDARTVEAILRSRGYERVVTAVDGRRVPARVLTKARYMAMEEFFAAAGPSGAWMMMNTASTQVNISHDQADPYRRWRLLHQVGPVLIAAFANSPGTDRQGRTWKSLRQAIWWDIDPRRTRPVAETGDPARAWLDYALSADLFFINEEGSSGVRGIGIGPGFSFGDWMQHGHDLGWPTVEDFAYHLSTLFPPVRPRGWLEIRFLDALPMWVTEVAALTVATISSMPDAGARLPDTTGLWVDASRNGMERRGLREAAVALFEFVEEHLGVVSQRADHRAAVREFADRYVRRGRCPGDDIPQVDLRLLGDRDLAGVASWPAASR